VKKLTKIYKYPLYPTTKQVELLTYWIAEGKWIYNYLLKIQEEDYQNKKQNPVKYLEFRKKHVLKQGAFAGNFSWTRALTTITQDMMKYKSKDYSHFPNLPSECITTIIEDAIRAYSDYVKNKVKIKNGTMKPPKGGLKLHKKYFEDDFSLHYRHSNTNIKKNPSSDSGTVYGFPVLGTKKSSGLKINYFREIDGKPTQQRIVRSGDKWFLCICTHKALPVGPTNSKTIPGSILGIDLGTKRTVQLSTGETQHMDLPYDSMKLLYEKKKSMQRRLKKKKEHSSNYKKAQKKIASIDEKLSKIRHFHLKMFADKISKMPVETVKVEALDIKNMTKSASGTKENPGKNVRAKSGLNRVILNSAPFFFKNFLKQQCKETGIKVKEVNPAYTSQMCSSCGHTDKENRITQAGFLCLKCGYIANADFNAAINISKKASIA
jgi:IS605 OrfB family transposase